MAFVPSVYVLVPNGSGIVTDQQANSENAEATMEGKLQSEHAPKHPWDVSSVSFIRGDLNRTTPEARDRFEVDPASL